MDEIKKLKEKYKDIDEFNDNLFEYLTKELPYDKYEEFVEDFIPVMDQYDIDEYNFDVIVSIVIKCNIGDFINNELSDYVCKALDYSINPEIINDKLKDSIKILNYKHFRELMPNGLEAMGMNNDNKSIINLFRHISKYELIRSMIHESLHQVTKYLVEKDVDKNKLLEEKNLSINKKINHLEFSGVSISYSTDDINSKEISWKRYFIRINEAITEYLTKRVLGQYYPEDDMPYKKEVSILEEMIDKGILNDELLIEAYTKNDYPLLRKNAILNSRDPNILDRFTNGYQPYNPYKR